MDHRAEIREFLSSRRARITPEQAGLPAYGGNRRVKGLRREEVAMLAGVSVDYYVRLERGNLAGASETRARRARPGAAARRGRARRTCSRSPASPASAGRRGDGSASQAACVRSIQQVLDAITDAPAWVRNGRHDLLAANQLARALYAPMLRRPATAREHRALRVPRPGGAGVLRRLGPRRRRHRRHPALRGRHATRTTRRSPSSIGELSTRSEIFRTRWAAHNVRFHRTGVKKLHHPVVGDLELDFEAMEFPSDPGLTLLVYTAAAGTPTADALELLASWAATQDQPDSDEVTDESVGTRDKE